MMFGGHAAADADQNLSRSFDLDHANSHLAIIQYGSLRHCITLQFNRVH